MLKLALKLRTGIVSLILSTLIIIPVIDSLMCISDSAVSHIKDSTEIYQTGAGLDDSPAHCSHDHCHHNVNVVYQFQNLGSLLHFATTYQWPEDDPLIAIAISGIKRPPRA